MYQIINMQCSSILEYNFFAIKYVVNTISVSQLVSDNLVSCMHEIIHYCNYIREQISKEVTVYG